VQIENNVIYSVLFEARYDLMTEVNPNHFVNLTNKELWRNILHTYQDKSKVSSDLVKTHIHNAKYTKQIKDSMYGIIDILADEVIVPDSSAKMREAMHHHFQRSVVLCLQNKLVGDIPQEVKLQEIDKAQRLLHEQGDDATMMPLQQKINQYVEDMESGQASRFKERSIEMHSVHFKKWFQGYVRPVPQIIAGAPGFNKTSLALNLIHEFYLLGKLGMVFTFEDSVETLRNKYLSIREEIGLKNVMDTDLSDEQKDKIRRNRKDVSKNKIWVSDESYTIQQFTREVDKQMAVREYDYVLIDFIELFRYNHREEPKELKLIMKEMVRLSTKYMLPIIILSQINYQDTEDVEPRLRDLFGSSGLEKMARLVSMIGGNRNSDHRRIYIRKNSYGGLYDFELRIAQSSGRIDGLA
jgi:replicative DNA helicase